MKGKMLLIRGLVASVVLAGFLLYAGLVVAQEELRVPMVSPSSITSLVEQVAIGKGWFKEIGYDAKVYSASGGKSAVILALEKGQLPFFSSDANIPLAIKPNSNIKIVASEVNKLLYFLVASKKVKSFKDLPRTGVTVGISTPSSGNVYVSLALLEKNGIKKSRLIKVGGSSARLAAVKAGKVDVGALTLGPMLKAKAAGLTILGSAGEVTGEFIMKQVAMNKNWVKQNRQKAVEIVGTLIRACDYVNRDREGTLQILTKRMKLKPEKAKLIYDIAIVKEKITPRRCNYTEKGIQEYLKSAKWSKAIAPDTKIPPISEFTMPDLYKDGLAWFNKR